MLVAFVSCTPSYMYTAFKCGSAADGAGCPVDQDCIYGRCRRTTQDKGNGIICNESDTCTQMEECCVNTNMHPTCEQADRTCPAIGALCDSKEDCTGGDHCCDVGGIITCDTQCDTIICQGSDDCVTNNPDGKGTCCVKTNRAFNDPLWGTCRHVCLDNEQPQANSPMP
jgi:hypothetical protein